MRNFLALRSPPDFLLMTENLFSPGCRPGDIFVIKLKSHFLTVNTANNSFFQKRMGITELA
jgi:hypothetical protein